MELLSRIGDGAIFIDTAPFVYFIERKLPYADLLRPLFNAIDVGEVKAITSTITCSETLVVPCRQGNRQLVAKYETLLTETPGLSIVPFDLGLARKTAIFFDTDFLTVLFAVFFTAFFAYSGKNHSVSRWSRDRLFS